MNIAAEKSTTLVPICLITDENISFSVTTVMISVLENSSIDNFFAFHCFISGKVSKDDINKMKLVEERYSNCSVEIIDMGDKYLDSKCTHRYVTNSCLYKFEIINYLRQYDKVIYLDTDVIVRGDLKDLYSTDLGSNYLAGVLSINKCILKPDIAKEIDIPDMDTFFNAGVMLMNLRLLREDNVVVKLESYIGQFEGSVDQLIFNKVCYGRVLKLPLKYNLIYNVRAFIKKQKEIKYYTQEEINEALKSPVIFHYAVDEKPWTYSGLIYGKEWDKYYKKSPYANQNLKRKSYLIKSFIECGEGFIKKVRRIVGKALGKTKNKIQ